MKKIFTILMIAIFILIVGTFLYSNFNNEPCISVLVSATNRITGESKVFSAPCEVPFWYKDVRYYNS